MEKHLTAKKGLCPYTKIANILKINYRLLTEFGIV